MNEGKARQPSFLLSPCHPIALSPCHLVTLSGFGKLPARLTPSFPEGRRHSHSHPGHCNDGKYSSISYDLRLKKYVLALISPVAEREERVFFEGVRLFEKENVSSLTSSAYHLYPDFGGKASRTTRKNHRFKDKHVGGIILSETVEMVSTQPRNF